MEIAPVPHRATRTEWRRLAVGVAILVPLVLLVMLPSVLGLDRYVVTDDGMDGTVGRGSVVLARQVPASDLEVGDVITFVPPGGGDEQATREIRSITGQVALADGDVAGESDVYRVPLDRSAYARVFVGVPWIGYPFVLDFGWVLLVALAVVAVLIGLAAGRRAPVRRSKQEQARASAASRSERFARSSAV